MEKAVIFDMDGLLVYTEEIHCKAYIDAFSHYGLNIDENDFYNHFTKYGRRLGEFIEMKDISVSEDDIRGTKRRIFEEMVRKNLPIAEGAEDVLKMHRGLYPIGLGTSSSRSATEIIMDVTGFEKYFDAIVTVDDSKHAKPDSACFVMSAEKLGVKPNRCIVVEDSKKGIDAAKKIGMKTVWIPNEITKNYTSFPDIRLESIMEFTPSLVFRM